MWDKEANERFMDLTFGKKLVAKVSLKVDWFEWWKDFERLRFSPSDILQTSWYTACGSHRYDYLRRRRHSYPQSIDCWRLCPRNWRIVRFCCKSFVRFSLVREETYFEYKISAHDMGCDKQQDSEFKVVLPLYFKLIAKHKYISPSIFCSVLSTSNLLS